MLERVATECAGDPSLIGRYVIDKLAKGLTPRRSLHWPLEENVAAPTGMVARSGANA